MAAIAEKARLRALALARRDGLDAGRRQQGSLDAGERADILLRRHWPSVLAGYWPIRSELDPLPAMERGRARGARLALPVTQASGLLFREWVEAEELLPSAFGTRAPGEAARALRPDMVLVPLAAFDRRGMRIGYGMGYYDRAIAEMAGMGHRPMLVGLAFAVQEVARVPAEPHDVALDFVVTEAEIIPARDDSPP